MTTSATHVPRTLWYAAKTGDLALLRTLVEVENEPFYAEDNEFKTPFYYGCSCDHPHVLKYLHELYAVHSLVLSKDQLQWCDVSCLMPDVRAFLQGKKTIDQVIADRDLEARWAAMSIWDAAAEGHLKKLRELASADPAIVASENASGQSPLQVAVMTNQVAAAGYLLPLTKAAMEADAFDALITRLAAQTSVDMMLQVLAGKATMKDIMMYQRRLAIR